MAKASMFYRPPHRPDGLRGDPFKAIVAPRPIGWISTVDAGGCFNLAPYSFFNAVSGDPPVVMFASEGEKDTLRAVEETGAFCCNLATRALAEAVNGTSAPFPRGTSEFAALGLEPEPAETVAAPRLKGAASVLECRLIKTDRLALPDGRPVGSTIVYGEVTGIAIDDRLLVDGRFDLGRAGAIARCGYSDYAEVGPANLFSMRRPTAA